MVSRGRKRDFPPFLLRNGFLVQFGFGCCWTGRFGRARLRGETFPPLVGLWVMLEFTPRLVASAFEQHSDDHPRRGAPPPSSAKAFPHRGRCPLIFYAIFGTPINPSDRLSPRPLVSGGSLPQAPQRRATPGPPRGRRSRDPFDTGYPFSVTSWRFLS